MEGRQGRQVTRLLSITFGPEERASAERLIDLALAEDLGLLGDVTALATIPPDAKSSGFLVARAPGVLSGMPVVDLLAERFALDSWHLEHDGMAVEKGAHIGWLSGSARAMLAMERTALNFLQRLSGVATLTARFVEEVAGTKASILDTRKTTPGWRRLEKYAVRCGGGCNHRMGLYDAVLIKDNHLAWIASSNSLEDPIARAVGQARAAVPSGTIVEIEVDSLLQLDFALQARPDIILVDNLGAESLSEAVRRRNEKAPEVLLEASGGVRLETVAALAKTGVDRMSVGALTHSAPALDIAFDFENELPENFPNY